MPSPIWGDKPIKTTIATTPPIIILLILSPNYVTNVEGIYKTICQIMGSGAKWVVTDLDDGKES